jgi:uncharacterized protein (DUF1697 family)
MNDLIAMYKTLGFDDENTVIKVHKESGLGNENNLIKLYKELGMGDENDLIAKHLGDKIAGLIHKNLHSFISYKDAKLEIEEIRNSQTVENLSEDAKNHVIKMCDKASEIIEINSKEEE